MHFLLGLIGSFLGGVVFGPINLSVVELTIRKNLQSALKFITAASLVEIFQAFIAVFFGKLISKKIDEFPEFRLLIIAFFLVLGLVFILKKNNSKIRISEETDSSRGDFFSGIVVAILNPQAIPYWIFVLTYLQTLEMIDLSMGNLLLFLAGVSAGKFLILSIYGYLSKYIKNRLSNVDHLISTFIGGLLILIGLIQAIDYYFFS